MNSLFLVSSAIRTKHGVFSAEERLQQTIATFESIKAKLSNAKIILCESSGAQSITAEEIEILQPHLFGLLNFNSDVQVQDIYAKTLDNHDIAKNFTELVVFGKVFDFLINKQPHLLNNIDRVFKLSGRYKLSDSFNPTMFESPEVVDKYMFAMRRSSQFSPNVTGGITQQLFSRLWSWPANKTALVMYRYNVMAEDFLGTLNKGQYCDIEHLLLKYFAGPFLHEVPQIGVTGKLGPIGTIVED